MPSDAARRRVARWASRALPAAQRVAGGPAGGVVRVPGEVPGWATSRAASRTCGAAASRAEDTTAEWTSTRDR